MQMSELVTAFFLSDLATQAVLDPESGLLKCLFPIACLIVIEFVISLLSVKVPIFKKCFDFSPSILIRNGKIQKKELLKNRMTIDELLSFLRQCGAYRLESVDFAILEPNGEMSVILRDEYETPSKKDLGLDTSSSGYSVAVIDDGKINDKALEIIGRSKKWLFDVLRQEKAEDVRDVFLLTSDFTGKTSIVLKSQTQ